MERPSTEAIGLERIVFCSDAIFAIAITLLVLDIHVPEVAADEATAVLPRRLLELWPRLLSYVTSFLVVGAHWTAHHHMSCYIKRYDQRLSWLNLSVLMTIAFLPLLNSLVGEYRRLQAAAVLYTAVLTLTGLLAAALWL